jgi:hypothetical protein
VAVCLSTNCLDQWCQSSIKVKNVWTSDVAPVQRHYTFHPKTQFCDTINKGGHEQYVRTPHTKMLKCVTLNWCSSLTALLLFHQLFLLPFNVSAHFSSHHTCSEEGTSSCLRAIIHWSFCLLKTVGSLLNYRLICSNTHLSSYLLFPTVTTNRPGFKTIPPTVLVMLKSQN